MEVHRVVGSHRLWQLLRLLWSFKWFFNWRRSVELALPRCKYVLVVFEVGDLGSRRHVRLVPIGARLVRAFLDPDLGFPLHPTIFPGLLLYEGSPDWLVGPEGDIAGNVFFWHGGAGEWLNLLQVDHPQLDVAAVVAGAYQLVAGSRDVDNFTPAKAQ